EPSTAYASTPSLSAPTVNHLDTTASSATTQPPVTGALSDTLQGITPAPQPLVVFAVAHAVTLLSGISIVEALTMLTLLFVPTAPPVQSVMSQRKLRRRCQNRLG